MITISIDLTKIDKSRIIAGKNGQKYFNLTVDNLKEPDKFGNTHTVYQSQTREERAAKTPKVYLGSGKEWIFEKVETVQAEEVHAEPQEDGNALPF